MIALLFGYSLGYMRSTQSMNASSSGKMRVSTVSVRLCNFCDLSFFGDCEPELLEHVVDGFFSEAVFEEHFAFELVPVGDLCVVFDCGIDVFEVVSEVAGGSASHFVIFHCVSPPPVFCRLCLYPVVPVYKCLYFILFFLFFLLDHTASVVV